MSTAGSVRGSKGESKDAHQGGKDPTPETNNTIVYQPRPLKVKEPDVFKGDRSKLRVFLTQAELYIGFNVDKFSGDQEKVLWASTYFRDGAFDWFDTYVRDFIDHKNDPENREASTDNMFASWNSFKTELNTMYGDIDEIRTAERKLNNLKQIGSATDYAAKFQQYAARTDWNYESQKAVYWMGLKDRVKDALVLGGRPKTLTTMISRSIEIDNDQYERELEKKGGNRIIPNRNNKFHKQKATYPVQMELDATHHGSKKRDWKKNKHQRKDKSKVICFGCGLAGHYKRDCKRKQLAGTQKQLNATSRNIAHDVLHWTGCYDDDCQVHFDGKDNGFFPKKPKNKKVGPADEPWERLDIPTSKILCADNDSEQYEPLGKTYESTPEETEAWGIAHDFVTEDYPEGLRFATDRRNSNPSFRNWAMKQQSRKEVQQKEHEELSTEQCRRYDCWVPHRPTWIPISGTQPRWINLIVEDLPEGGVYTREGGYWTPDGGYIAPTLRERAKKLAEEYMACKPQDTPKN